MRPASALVPAFLSAAGALAAVFDLSTLDWTLRNQNGSITVPGKVPSQVHLDLARAGVITEPLLGDNDFTQRWVFMDNWTYTADLSAFLRTNGGHASQHLLVFHGLDTIANISVAGNSVAWVNNQFRQYTFDVSFLDEVRAGNITVAFESAYWYGLNVSTRPDVVHIIGDVFEIDAGRSFVRKTDSDFGWDWGPAFLPSGIFKPAYLISLSTSPTSPAHETIYIEETSLDIYKLGQNFSSPPNQSADWVVNVTLALHSAVAFVTPTLRLSIPEAKLESPTFKLVPINKTATAAQWISIQWHIPDEAVQRWWPWNLGTPKLYNISIELSPTSSSTLTETVLTGFRTIELVQAPYPPTEIAERGLTPGDQWHFSINGKEFYSLGTNIIPFDPFYARITTEQVQWVLESAVLSGQNMLRIWGGGIYQPSSTTSPGDIYSFYALCDQLGILAWSEYIFSDTLYPINDFLLTSIEPEVRQNVRRVNKHPSNVQWAGGNEIEGIVLNVNASQPNGTAYLDQFLFLFQNFLHDITVSETRSVPYTDCSTTRGVLSLDPYELRLLNVTPGEIYGNSERYNYDASQAFNYATFPVSRFVNEFGFHSMPSFYTWEEVLTSPDDFSLRATFLTWRIHLPRADSLVLTWLGTCADSLAK
ncbi:Glycoside hydrolase family 2 protein [Mycena kentingensis (nom. inval.)]|nr:Glycoside hydrolase family 2 protein [Mycena kentingensis (nom. inval.)]